MYVKESLVYDKHTGSLTGYSDMSDVSNLFGELEEEQKKFSFQATSHQMCSGVHGQGAI